MNGYKGTYDSKCLRLTYEIGKTYELIGDIIVCLQGFHFCKRLSNVFGYYPHDKNKGNLIVYKIDTLDGEVIRAYDQFISNKIKILEKVDISNYLKVDQNNNLIWEKDYYNEIWEYKYNHNNHIIWQKKPDGKILKWEHKYDENNNKIWYKDPYGVISEGKYDENNNLILFQSSFGEKIKYKYDENNNLIWYKDFNLYSKKNNCYGCVFKYKYDENGNIIWKEDGDGSIWEWKYDENNNIIWEKNFLGMIEERKYDERGNEILYKKLRDVIIERKYDDNDNCIWQKVDDREHFTNREYFVKIY